jgi:hypothetical protein
MEAKQAHALAIAERQAAENAQAAAETARRDASTGAQFVRSVLQQLREVKIKADKAQAASAQGAAKAEPAEASDTTLSRLEISGESVR